MSKSLSHLVTRDLICIHWSEQLGSAYRLITDKRIRHLPVVDHRGMIVGIISDHDFYRAMHIDQPDFTSGKAPQPEFDPNSRVRDYMSWPIETIDERATIAVAARIMIDKKISSLIVTRATAVIGIVTTEDMLRIIAAEPSPQLETFKDRIREAIYDSPIGTIAQTLANAGI